MKDVVKENNRLRLEQMGNRPASELTKREHIAALALQGLLAKDQNSYNSYQEVVDNAVYITDLLIEKLNQNKDNTPLTRSNPDWK